MILKHFLLLAFSLLGILVVLADDPPYPDFSCHRVGVNEAENTDAEDWLRMINGHCDEDITLEPPMWSVCKKVCILMQAHLLHYSEYKLLEYEVIKDALDTHIYANEAATDQITKQILSECSDKATSMHSEITTVNDRKCEDWDEFLSCMEATWSCKK